LITKIQIKNIKSLKLKKFRDLNQLFVVETPKNVSELIRFAPEYITDIYHTASANVEGYPYELLQEISENDMAQITQLSSASSILALVKMPIMTDIHQRKNLNEPIVYLDEIRDPGNLGTIIRAMDWFGWNTLVCSENSVDFYNPKVIQSSMGAFFRVQKYQLNFQDLYQKCPNYDIIGTFMEGMPLAAYEKSSKPRLLIMGSESHGISPEIAQLVTHRLTIPKFGETESLNVAMATSICLYELTST
jgi:TrmH family RNA methyltransferase